MEVSPGAGVPDSETVAEAGVPAAVEGSRAVENAWKAEKVVPPIVGGR